MKKKEEPRKILVTGVGGTIGGVLVDCLLQESLRHSSPVRIIGIDQSEAGLFQLQEKYHSKKNVELKLTSIRDRESIAKSMKDVDQVFHLAALKHVGLTEPSASEAVNTNVLGTVNVVEVAVANGVRKVIFASSDKAVNPTSVMGTTKLLGEKIVASANLDPGETILSSVRFGNVIGSSGSVIPLFRSQIESGGPAKLTSVGMTRFVMTKEQAAVLMIEASRIMNGGEVFVTKMDAIRIETLLNVMIEHYRGHHRKVQKVIVGKRPGEKLYEELLAEEEYSRAYSKDNFLIIPPALSDLSGNVEDTNALRGICDSRFSSSLNEEEISNLLGAWEEETISDRHSPWFNYP